MSGLSSQTLCLVCPLHLKKSFNKYDKIETYIRMKKEQSNQEEINQKPIYQIRMDINH